MIPHLPVTRSVTAFHRITPSLPPLGFHVQQCLLPNKYVWILALFCFSGEQKILENRAIFCFCLSLIRQFVFCSCDKKKKRHSESSIGEERVYWLTLLGHGPSLREVKVGTQAENLKQRLRKNVDCWLACRFMHT